MDILIWLIVLGLVVMIPVAIVVLLLVFVSKTRALGDRVEALESEIGRLRRQLNEFKQKPQQPAIVPTQTQPRGVLESPPTRITAREPLPPPTPMPPAQKREPIRQPMHEPARPVEPPPGPAAAPPTLQPAAAGASSSHIPRPAIPPRPPAPTIPPSPPSRTRAEWESFIGGKLLNRIGAFALVLGIGFFLKYAFDRNLIPPWGQVATGFAVGVSLLLLGWRSGMKGFQVFAQGLVGAGIAILYLSSYASFNYYQLVSQPVAFVMMSAVTLLTFVLALRYDSLAVFCLGWLGGFLTPLLLRTDQPNEVGLFGYIALLDAGVLAILARKERWYGFELLTLAATFLWYLGWYDQYYTPADLAVTAGFLTLFWFLFYAIDVYRVAEGIGAHGSVRQATAIFNALFYYAALYTIVDEVFHNATAPITLVLGTVYFVTILWLRLTRPVQKLVFARYTLSAIILLVLATTIHYTGLSTVTLWAVEAAALVWCGVHWRLKHVWGAALILFGLASVKLLTTPGALEYQDLVAFNLLINRRALALGVLGVTLAASALFLGRGDDDSESAASYMLHYWWVVAIFGLVTVETSDYFRALSSTSTDLLVRRTFSYQRWLTLGIAWVIYSLPLAAVGFRGRIKPLIHCGLIVLAFAAAVGLVVGSFYVPLDHFKLIFNYRAAALLVILGGLLVHIIWLSRNDDEDSWFRPAAALVTIVWCVALFVLCTAETVDFFQRRLIGTEGDARRSVNFISAMTLVVVWSAYAAALAWFGIRRRVVPVICSAFIVLALAVSYVSVKGFEFEPVARFELLGNMRSLAIGTALLGVLFLIRLLKGEEKEKWRQAVLRIAQYGTGFLLFFWITVETNDYFRRSLAGSTDAPSLQYQRAMTFVIAWMAYSLAFVWYGAKRNASPILHCGLIAGVTALILSIVRGIDFEPAAEFVLGMNARAYAMGSVIVGLIVLTAVLKSTGRQSSLIAYVIRVLPAIIALVLFELLSVETKDYFDRIIAAQWKAGGENLWIEVSRTRDLQQMSLSVVWVIYSILLTVYGLMRRKAVLRILAIGLFGVAILKIFIYDLSFLKTLYRIFSFIALGVILVLVSYLYQRYKSFIFEASPKSEAAQ